MIGRIVRDCAIGAGVVVAGKLLSNYAEKNPKLKVVKDNISKTGQEFARNCGEVGRSIIDMFRKDDGMEAAQNA